MGNAWDSGQPWPRIAKTNCSQAAAKDYIYPLPLATNEQMAEACSDMSDVPQGALNYVNSVVVVLNHTYGVRAPVRMPSISCASALQTDVIKRIIESSRQLADRLDTCLPTHTCYADAWSEYERQGASKSVRLKASLVDNVIVCLLSHRRVPTRRQEDILKNGASDDSSVHASVRILLHDRSNIPPPARHDM